MTPREAIQHLERERAQIRSRLNRYARYNELDDLIQLGYVRLLRMSPLIDIQTPVSYFLTICRHELYAQHSSKEAQAAIEHHATEYFNSIPDPSLTPEQRLEFDQELAQIITLLGTLSPRAQRVFEMAFMEGYIYKEIARQFRVSESMVKKYLATAKRRLGIYEGKLLPRDVPACSKRQAGSRGSTQESASTRATVGRKT